MKIIFDTEACKKNNRDVDLILYLISVYCNANINVNTFEKARQQNWLKFEEMYNRNNPFPINVSLTKDGEFLIESIMADSQTNSVLQKNDDRFTNLANKLRDLYPEGKKPGYQYMWKDSTSVIANRLKKFVLKYADYTDEQIIDATKRYIASFNGNYQYMQLLKYFIWKNKISGAEYQNGVLVGEVEPQSQLASFLENSEEAHTNNNWDITLK